MLIIVNLIWVPDAKDVDQTFFTFSCSFNLIVFQCIRVVFYNGRLQFRPCILCLIFCHFT